MADREFVGQEWLDYLNREHIRYYIRIRNNFKVYIPQKSKTIKASHLFNQNKIGQLEHYPKIVVINNVYCYISCLKAKADDVIIISFNKNEQSLLYYEQRWQIEMCFRALKSSGFDIENTHLVDIERIERLLLIVMIAFVWCYKIEVFLHKHKPIIIKTHGRKAKSIFKYGLDFIAKIH